MAAPYGVSHRCPFLAQTVEHHQLQPDIPHAGACEARVERDHLALFGDCASTPFVYCGRPPY
eukprot:gene6907-2636_t